MSVNFHLLFYYLTSINQYSFGVLVFLFVASFVTNSKKVNSIILLRILLVLLIITFYIIGWRTIEYGVYNKLVGRKIPYDSHLLKVCPMKAVNEILNGQFYNPVIAIKYNCALEKANDTFFKYSNENKILVENKIVEPILINENFKVSGTINIHTVGLLLHSFGNDYTLLIIKDSKNNTYIAGKEIIEGESE